MKLVIDSSNRNPITATDLSLSKAVALISKATEGTSFKDWTLESQRAAARKVGVPFGSYLFLQPTSTGSEAQFYLDYAKPEPGEIQPIIDAEATQMGTAALAKRARSCAAALMAAGYNPILYASASIWKDMILVEPWLKRLRVWEADYPGRFTRWFPWLAQKRIKLLNGATVVLWQWTDEYAVGSRRFDASALFVDVETLKIPASSGTSSGKEVAL